MIPGAYANQQDAPRTSQLDATEAFRGIRSHDTCGKVHPALLSLTLSFVPAITMIAALAAKLSRDMIIGHSHSEASGEGVGIGEALAQRGHRWAPVDDRQGRH